MNRSVKDVLEDVVKKEFYREYQLEEKSDEHYKSEGGIVYECKEPSINEDNLSVVSTSIKKNGNKHRKKVYSKNRRKDIDKKSDANYYATNLMNIDA